MSINNDKRAIMSETEGYEKATRTKNAKKRGKFNIIDAILIVVVLAAVASIVAYFLPGITSYFTREDEYVITYKIEIRGVDGDIDLKNISDGMPVYDVINNYEIGKIKGGAVTSPHMLLVNSGERSESESNGYKGE